jgi:hypothetical protein
MIKFSFALQWPTPSNEVFNTNQFSRSGDVSVNKAYELNTYYRGWRELVGFHFDLTPTGRSHAGLYLSAHLLGFEIEFEFYDKRHWNYDAERWATPEEHGEW